MNELLKSIFRTEQDEFQTLQGCYVWFFILLLVFINLGIYCCF
jgi:hypothetical protein